MWIKRDILSLIANDLEQTGIRVNVLKGPRQVGKTSLLERLSGYKLLAMDDHILRSLARENPSLFLDQYPGAIILDEATLVPELFYEIKKRVDESKRNLRKGLAYKKIDYWLTGSNQTLLSLQTQESLAGRAYFYDINTLSIHEHKKMELRILFMRGGWPELYADEHKDPVKFINGLISTFIEKDIAEAAGIEKKAAFLKVLHLLAGQVGGMLNYSSIASMVGVEMTTVQGWVNILSDNHLISVVQPYLSNLNKRLIKTPKLYFDDVGLAVRLQGWSEFNPIYVSPYFGHLVECLAYSEIAKFFYNSGFEKKIFFIRSKEKVEIDLLVELPNQRFVAIEVKATATSLTKEQYALIDSLALNVIEIWMLTPNISSVHKTSGRLQYVGFDEIYERLKSLTEIT
jgi:predicted AAA+ superfamily ATPase